jgi:hypothetical protein
MFNVWYIRFCDHIYFPLSKIVAPQKIKIITSFHFINCAAIMATRPAKQANQTGCCKPPSYVPYKGTYVPYDGTFGVPDQGQMLDV